MSIHRVDDEHANFLQKTAENVKKVTGQPTSPQSLNPNDDSLGESIQRDVRHLMGSTLEEGFGGASNSTQDRATKGWIPALIGRLRRRIKK